MFVWLLRSNIGRALLGVFGVAAIVLGLIAYGAARERAAQEAAANENYIEGTQDARDALSDLPADPVDGLRSIPF